MPSEEEKAALRPLAEPMPYWLATFRPGMPFPFKEFKESRVIVYPGSGTDGRPVELFGSTHAAHCFIYADYLRPRTDIEEALDHPAYGFRGYRSLCRVTLSEGDLTPRKWRPHVYPVEVDYTFREHHVAPFGFLEVLEREDGFDDAHGPERLAIVFLGADGIATYDALFCQEGATRGPFGLVVIDHGFGGGYARFDNGGLLHSLAKRCSVFPEYLWVPYESSVPWNEYHPVEIHGQERPALYKRAQRIGGED
jgi:hypothetical protein